MVSDDIQYKTYESYKQVNLYQKLMKTGKDTQLKNRGRQLSNNIYYDLILFISALQHFIH